MWKKIRYVCFDFIWKLMAYSGSLPYNFYFLLRIPDTSMIENIIMSSRAPQTNVNGLIVVFVDENFLEPVVRFEPLISGMVSRRANH